MLRLSLLFCLVLTLGTLSGQNVTLRGQATDYAGQVLNFYTYPEPVSHLQRRLASASVARDGTFSLSFKVAQAIEVYTDLEKFRGTILVEPGSDYTISLPPYSPRTRDEAASPYFKPEMYWLGIKGVKTSDLNFLARAFLTDYNREYSSHLQDLYQRKSSDTVKAIISRLEKNHPFDGNKYLKTLKTCSFGLLEYAVEQPDREKVIRKYFASSGVNLSHPAYQELFGSLFSDYLVYKSLDITGKEKIRQAMSGDFAGWVGQLKQSGLNQETAELVAVKSFYDGYYSNKADKTLMLKGLKEASEKAAYPPLKEILPGIIKSVTTLQEGSTAPALKLKDSQNVTSSLRSNGKYIYLVFFKTDSKDSRSELDSLLLLDKKLNPVLNIVPVSMDKNFDTAIKLWQQKKYPWKLYRPADPDKVNADYLVNTVPVFYLLSTDLTMLLSPALAPSRNFEALFLKIYREGRFKK